MLRRLIYILGGLTLFAIVVAAAGFGIIAYKGHVLDAESKAYVDSAVPAIAGHWSKDELLDRATPELRASAKLDELTALFFNAQSQFGPMLKYEGAIGEAMMSYMAGSGGAVSASYVARAQFRSGSAIFRIVLLKRDGHWMIQNFHIDRAPGDQTERGT
jgi:hypothetical protein